jgi:putative intracellular protease/amidase
MGAAGGGNRDEGVVGGVRKETDMPEKAVYLLVVEGFADWEPAHAVAELRRTGNYRVESVGLTPDPIVSMGGLRVLPSATVRDVDPSDVAAFIIPGGDRWEAAPIEPEIVELLTQLDRHGVPVAAICAGTTVIAKTGLLRGRRHTSNSLEYLRSQVPGYIEAVNYVDTPAVRDRGLITASGLADVEFARELFEELNVLTADDRASWSQIFRSGQMPKAEEASRG